MLSAAERLKKLKGMKSGGSQSTPPTSRSLKKPPAAKKKVAVEKNTQELLPPPWTLDDCAVCDGLGFSVKGDPCRICQAKTRVDAGDYELVNHDDGTTSWHLEGEEDKIQFSHRTTGPVPEVKTKEVEAEAEAEAEAEDEVVQAPLEKAPRPSPAQIHKNATKGAAINKVGRPKKGFMLVINAAISGETGKPRSGRHVHDIRRLFRRCAEKMAVETGVDHYTDLDPFKRRDAFERMGQDVSEEFSSDIAQIDMLSSGMCDIKAFVDGIRSQASVVIHGIAG